MHTHAHTTHACTGTPSMHRKCVQTQAHAHAHRQANGAHTHTAPLAHAHTVLLIGPLSPGASAMTASPLITSLQHTVCRGLPEEHPEPSGNAPWHKAAVTEVGWHGDKMSSLGNDSSKEHSGAEPAVSPRSRSPGIGTARFLVMLSCVPRRQVSRDSFWKPGKPKAFPKRPRFPEREEKQE